jgi:hypothetical protein
MSTLLRIPRPVQSPCGIKVVRDPEPIVIREDERDQVAAWFEAQQSWYRLQEADYPDRHYSLCVTAFNDLVIASKRTKARSAQDIIAGTDCYRDVVLSEVRVPEHRSSTLATILDEEAGYFLMLDTDLGRLAAYALLYHAEGAEYHGASTVQELLDAEDECLAWLNAMEDVFDPCTL